MMKIFKLMVIILVFSIPFTGFSQDTSEKEGAKIDKKSYYENRGEADAKFEQQLKSNEDDEENEFWEDQRAYEKDLKKRDKKAYKAYQKGKRDAYKEHYEHCDSHHHSDHYYRHASFYYHGYYNYDHSPRYRRNTTVRIGVPRVRLNIL